jgi:xanthine dehydrogenase accessory factor
MPWRAVPRRPRSACCSRPVRDAAWACPRPLVDDWLVHSVDVLAAAGCAPVVVVLGAAHQQAQALLHGRPVGVAADARGLLAVGRSQCLSYGPIGERRGEGMRVFVQSFAPPPRMLVFGAIDYAAAVARIGGFLGYRVTVCDARPLFATPDRFPGAAEVIVDWPHRYLRREAQAGNLDSRTVVCVLTHDPKFDVPVLSLALRLPALAYVGAMGSRQTHLDRLDRLRASGLTDCELSRLSSPIGLDLGGRTPEETAVSIAAEIVATRSGGSGARLRDLDQSIHTGRPS